MKFYTVDVKNITSDIPSANFADNAINSLAELIIESGGIIRPLILTTIGLETYKVVDGHFEYYAAVRAREKNPRQCEMVNAFVISPNHEDKVLKQVSLFKESKSDNQSQFHTLIENQDVKPKYASNNYHLLEKQIQELRAEVAQERQRLFDAIKVIETQTHKQITPLEVFNTLPLIEIVMRLKTAGFTDKKAVQIAESIEKERKNKKFESLKDVIQRIKISSGKKQIKGISGEKMIDIVDSWSRILFV
jgi:predicted nucleic acid-binding OB-fold protein